MPSKEFLDFQSQIPTMPPIGDLPGGPIQENIPPEFASLGVPILPPDYTSPEPVIPSDFFGGKTEVNGVPGLHVMRGDVRAGCAHLYIHGGGFTIGSAMTSGEFLAYFLEKTGLEGYAVEYRLAPYHPFPAAITDCLEFYQGLLNMGYDRIVVGGESAGASLTLGLVHALKMENLPLPAAIWCSSPVDDISYGERETYKTDMFTECSEGVRKAYAPDGDLKDPRISPIYGDFSLAFHLCLFRRAVQKVLLPVQFGLLQPQQRLTMKSSCILAKECRIRLRWTISIIRKQTML